jgi:hypothetical protein
MSIRALDYCPPVDISFGDYLRAMITADTDLVPNDEWGYRIAMIDAFKKRGIYPRDIKTLSPETLRWERFEKGDTEQISVFTTLAETLRRFVHQLDYLDKKPGDLSVKGRNWKKLTDREKIFLITEAGKEALAELLADYKRLSDSNEVLRFEQITGLHLLQSDETHEPVNGLEFVRSDDRPGFTGKYLFEVHSLRGARRVSPDGNSLNQVVISITQNRIIPFDRTKKWDDLTDEQKKVEPVFRFRGGCTLILDLQDLSLRYAIVKNFEDKILPDKGLFIENERLTRQRNYRTGLDGLARRATYFGTPNPDGAEPFAMLHRNF